MIAKELGTAIVTGHRQPGSTLPVEIELAEQSGVSRGVVREALRMLSAKGLIESRPKAGTRVRARDDWNLLDPDILAWMFTAAPSLEFVRALFQLRMIIEPAAAELAAVGRSACQMTAMNGALLRMEQYGLDTAEGQSADQEFHALLLRATGNPLIVSMSGSIAAAVRWTTFFKYGTSRHPDDPIPQHRALYDAIAAGDAPGARAATVTLVHQALMDTEHSLDA